MMMDNLHRATLLTLIMHILCAASGDCFSRAAALSVKSLFGKKHLSLAMTMARMGPAVAYHIFGRSRSLMGPCPIQNLGGLKKIIIINLQ